MADYKDYLAALSEPQHRSILTQLKRGIEKEGLRCDTKGAISQRPHARALGSTLKHPYITTDYSEALLEFISPVFNSAQEALAFLTIAHRFTYQHLQDELVWPSSMPCVLHGEMSIPIADYGSSNLGQLKHIYRHGLWHRYGRMMQCISGIHYNFSLPDRFWELAYALEGEHGSKQAFISRRYFDLIRNFRRYGWLLLYLFGASPAVCKSFFDGHEHNLDTWMQHTLISPFATSLRMSDLGYQSNAQSSLNVCYNSLESYVTTLGSAVTQPQPEYETLGVKSPDGRYQQLNTHLLQIENEYYSDVRPKRVSRDGKKPLQALASDGVEYIEIRSTDINPFMPLGMDVAQIQFMDTFLLFCALTPSPKFTDSECQQTRANQNTVILQGRKPNVTLMREQGEISLVNWGHELIEQMKPLAALIDQAQGGCQSMSALSQQSLKLADASLTPSAQVLDYMKQQQQEFTPLMLALAKRHRQHFAQPLTGEVGAHWQAIATQSLAAQKELEMSDHVSFDTYLRDYLSS